MPLADETILRMALAMFAADVTSPATPNQRAWIVQRLQGHGARRPFTPAEYTMVQAPLLAWYHQAHPRTAALVARQFGAEG